MSVSFYNINHNPMYNIHNVRDVCDVDKNMHMALEPIIPLKLDEPLLPSKYINISNTYIKSDEKNDSSDIKYKILDLYFKYRGDTTKIYEKIGKNDDTEKIIETVHLHFQSIGPGLKQLIIDQNEDIYELCREFLFFNCDQRDFSMWMESNTALRSIAIRFIAIELRDFFSILNLKTV